MEVEEARVTAMAVEVRVVVGARDEVVAVERDDAVVAVVVASIPLQTFQSQSSYSRLNTKDLASPDRTSMSPVPNNCIA